MNMQEVCKEEFNMVSPFAKDEVAKIIVNVPKFVRAIIIFGSCADRFRADPWSDVDILIVTDDDMDILTYKEEFNELVERITMEKDITTDSFDNLREYMNRGNSEDQFYRDIWDEGLLVYSREEQ